MALTGKPRNARLNVEAGATHMQRNLKAGPAAWGWHLSQTILYRGWQVAFTGAAINVVLGGWYAWSVIAKAISNSWGWSQTQCGMPFAAATICFSLTMIFAGRVQDWVGPSVVAVAGGLLVGCALIFSSFTQDPWSITLAYGVLGGVGIGIGYSGTVPAAVKWFPPQRKGLISGIVVAGVGLSAVFMAPLANALLHRFGIQQTFLMMGIAIGAITAALGTLLQNPPEGFNPFGDIEAKTRSPAAAPDMNWDEMLRTPQFYMLWLMYVLAVAPGLMVIANAVQILSRPQEQLFNPVIAPMILAAFNTAGRVAGGFVSDRIGIRGTLMLVSLLQAANMAHFPFWTSQPGLMAGFALTGLFYGAFFALVPAAAAGFYGLKNMGVNYGLIATSFGVAGLTGALAGGRIRDLLGSYDVAYWIFAVTLSAAAILAFFTRAPTRREKRPGGG